MFSEIRAKFHAHVAEQQTSDSSSWEEIYSAPINTPPNQFHQTTHDTGPFFRRKFLKLLGGGVVHAGMQPIRRIQNTLSELNPIFDFDLDKTGVYDKHPMVVGEGFRYNDLSDNERVHKIIQERDLYLPKLLNVLDEIGLPVPENFFNNLTYIGGEDVDQTLIKRGYSLGTTGFQRDEHGRLKVTNVFVSEAALDLWNIEALTNLYSYEEPTQALVYQLIIDQYYNNPQYFLEKYGIQSDLEMLDALSNPSNLIGEESNFQIPGNWRVLAELLQTDLMRRAKANLKGLSYQFLFQPDGKPKYTYSPDQSNPVLGKMCEALIQRCEDMEEELCGVSNDYSKTTNNFIKWVLTGDLTRVNPPFVNWTGMRRGVGVDIEPNLIFNKKQDMGDHSVVFPMDVSDYPIVAPGAIFSEGMPPLTGSELREQTVVINNLMEEVDERPETIIITAYEESVGIAFKYIEGKYLPVVQFPVGFAEKNEHRDFMITRVTPSGFVSNNTSSPYLGPLVMDLVSINGDDYPYALHTNTFSDPVQKRDNSVGCFGLDLNTSKYLYDLQKAGILNFGGAIVIAAPKLNMDYKEFFGIGKNSRGYMTARKWWYSWYETVDWLKKNSK